MHKTYIVFFGNEILECSDIRDVDAIVAEFPDAIVSELDYDYFKS